MQPGKLTHNLNAGRKACAQLVRAVPSATSAPLRRAAAACALATLHELMKRAEFCMAASFTDYAELREVALAVITIYYVSLREIAAFRLTESREDKVTQDGQDGSSSGTGASNNLLAGAGGSATGGPKRAGSRGESSGGAGNSCGTSDPAASRAKESLQEDWVPLLVDSSGVIGCCILDGAVTIKDGLDHPTAHDDQLKTQLTSCAVSMVSALLHSNALPALISRLLSAEVNHGPAWALLTPHQLATCLEPLTQLLMATADGRKSGGPFQTLGPAVLCAVAASGVVEAACRVVVPLVVQHGSGGRQQQQKQVGCRTGDGREQLLIELMDLLHAVSSALFKADSVVQRQLQRRILAGPCAQVSHAKGCRLPEKDMTPQPLSRQQVSADPQMLDA